MSELHVVLGAGQVGPLVARGLLARGLRVRVVRRGQGASGVPGVEDVSADVSDAAEVARVTGGAAAVYHCASPAYDRWDELLLPMTRGIVEGVKRSGASLIALDNVYMHGDTAHITHESPVAPRSKKGALRAEAAGLMLEAGRRGDLRVAIGRAADFFGPKTPYGSIFGERFYRRVLAGKPGECFGDPDLPHSYSYTPDVAAGLVALGTAPGARGVYVLPVQPAETTRQVMGRFYRELGRDLGVSRVPTLVLRGMGLFSPIVRELVEMVYQWQQPYALDDTRIRAELGVEPTPWPAAVAATLSWARTAYGVAAAA